MSTLSSKSRILSKSYEDELNENELASLPVLTLDKLINTLEKEVDILKIENELYTSTILRVDPALYDGIRQAAEYAVKVLSRGSVASLEKSQSVMNRIESSHRTRSMTTPSLYKQRSLSMAKFSQTTLRVSSAAQINVLEKLEMIEREIQICNEKLQKTKMESENLSKRLNAQLEELQIREKRIDKCLAQFKEFVLIGGFDPIAQRVPAEIWIRFMAEQMKRIDSSLGKIRLRLSTYNTTFFKLKAQIKIKKEISETLRPVDYDKLGVENQDYTTILEKQKKHLEGAKQMCGDASLVLTVHKKGMIAQDNNVKLMLEIIEKRKKQMIDLEKEKQKIRDLAAIEEKALAKFRRLNECYKVPDLYRYLQVKLEHDSLKKENRRLERISFMYSSLTK